MRCVLFVLGLMGCAGPIECARADETRTVSLNCGGTRFTAISHSVHDYATSQEMWAHPRGAGHGRKVDLRQSTFVLQHSVPGLAVLADKVGGWACVTTPKATFVILMYVCPQTLPDDVPARFCGDSGEWYRYVALDGSLLDEGFGLGPGGREPDPRAFGLRARLGLPPDDEKIKAEDVF